MFARALSSIIIAALVATPSLAEDVLFEVNLEPAQGVPAPGPFGSITVVFDTDNLGATWIIAYEGLTGQPTAVRFVSGDGDGTEVLSIVGNLASPIVGGASLDQAQAALLIAGAIAVVIQSTAFPAGELRAQVVPTGVEAGAGAE